MLSYHHKNSKEQGFTLIELLVVIAIIGLLSSIVLASLQEAKAKATSTQTAEGARALRAALELYHLDHNSYPTGEYNSSDSSWDTLSSLLTPTYIPNLPSNSSDVLYLYEGTINSISTYGSDMFGIKCYTNGNDGYIIDVWGAYDQANKDGGPIPSLFEVFGGSFKMGHLSFDHHQCI